jgi:hypothetical protein
MEQMPLGHGPDRYLMILRFLDIAHYRVLYIEKLYFSRRS